MAVIPTLKMWSGNINLRMDHGNQGHTHCIARVASRPKPRHVIPQRQPTVVLYMSMVLLEALVRILIMENVAIVHSQGLISH